MHVIGDQFRGILWRLAGHGRPSELGTLQSSPTNKPPKEADWPNLMGPDGKGEGPQLQMAQGTAQIPDHLLEDVITAAEDCPGECIFIEE